MALVVLLAGASCSYAKEEPGLFSQRESASPPPTAPPEPAPEPPEATNPRLPVAGQQTWVSADGLDLQIRLAVHAVRRMPGATVLDWSITPVRGAGLRFGERIPAGLGLGLTRELQGDVNVMLLDPGRGRVYRPLSHRSAQKFFRCLCSPVWVAQLTFRIGETRLLQVVYPALPRDVLFVDVDLTTVPPIVHVPVTPVGQVPTAGRPTDLQQRLPPSRAASRPVEFPYPRDRSRRRQSVTVEEVVAAPGHTSMRWTIRSLTDQTGFGLLPLTPPLAAELTPGLTAVTQNAVSGPRLQPAAGTARPLAAWWMTESYTGQRFVECLCTELGLWASELRESGGEVSVTTLYPPLPPGVATVDVLLPGVPTRVSRVPVSRAVDSAAQLGAPADAPEQEPWRYLTERPPSGWQTTDWPTPLPAADQLRDYLTGVEELVRTEG